MCTGAVLYVCCVWDNVGSSSNVICFGASPGSDAEARANTLATGEERVPHGLVETLRVHLGDGVGEALLDGFVLLLDVSGEVELGSLHGGRGSLGGGAQ